MNVNQFTNRATKSKNVNQENGKSHKSEILDSIRLIFGSRK